MYLSGDSSSISACLNWFLTFRLPLTSFMLLHRTVDPSAAWPRRQTMAAPSPWAGAHPPLFKGIPHIKVRSPAWRPYCLSRAFPAPEWGEWLVISEGWWVGSDRAPSLRDTGKDERACFQTRHVRAAVALMWQVRLGFLLPLGTGPSCSLLLIHCTLALSSPAHRRSSLSAHVHPTFIYSPFSWPLQQQSVSL